MQWVLFCFRQVGINLLHCPGCTYGRVPVNKREALPACAFLLVLLVKNIDSSQLCRKAWHHGPPLSHGEIFWTPFHEEGAPKSDAVFQWGFQRSGRHGPKMLWSRQQQCRSGSCAPGSSNCPLRHVAPDSFTSRLLLLQCWKTVAIKANFPSRSLDKIEMEF